MDFFLLVVDLLPIGYVMKKHYGVKNWVITKEDTHKKSVFLVVGPLSSREGKPP